MKKRLLALGLMAALASTDAGAQVLLNDTFAGENSGGTALNYSAFTNWSVTGAVDIIGPGNGYGITCSGSCVDLSGSSGPGKLTSNPFAFNSGDVLRVSFNLSGSQRGSGPAQFQFMADFGAGANLHSYMGTGGAMVGGAGAVGSISSYQNTFSLLGQAPFQLYTWEFRALGSGAVSYSFAAPEQSSIGPILDDVLVERVVQQSIVPEPSTYAMLALGLGAVAFAARRRSARA